MLSVGYRYAQKRNFNIIKAGQERFRAIAQPYYRRSHGALLMFDITRRETFTALPRWIEDITTNSNENTKITVIGNKKDMEHVRQVTENEADVCYNNTLTKIDVLPTTKE
jgi:GTPase SAR1 family protein